MKILKTYILNLISAQVQGSGPAYLFTTDSNIPYRLLYINSEDVIPPYFVNVADLMKKNEMTPYRKYKGDIYYGIVKNDVFYAVTKMVR
jgi:hypothetical protein